MAELIIEAATQIRLTAIKEYRLEAGEQHGEDDDRYFRILSIETESGPLDLEISAVTWDALEIVQEA